MDGQLVLDIAQSVIDALDVVSLVNAAQPLLQLVDLVSLVLQLLLVLIANLLQLGRGVRSISPRVDLFFRDLWPQRFHLLHLDWLAITLQDPVNGILHFEYGCVKVVRVALVILQSLDLLLQIVNLLLLVEVVLVLILLELVDFLVDVGQLLVVVSLQHHVLFVAQVVEILDDLGQLVLQVLAELGFKLLLVHVHHVLQLLPEPVHHVFEGRHQVVVVARLVVRAAPALGSVLRVLIASFSHVLENGHLHLDVV